MLVDTQNRDVKYLNHLFENILREYFPDLIIKNPIRVQFGRKNARRLGSISLKRGSDGQEYSLIRLNGHFQNPEIPEYILQATLIHELVHYLHGFNSHHSQRYRHPHRNGVVSQEFTNRSLKDLLKQHKMWLKNNWPTFLKNNHTFRPRQHKKSFIFRIKVLGR